MKYAHRFVLKNGVLSTFVPTQRAHVEDILIGGVQFHTWDLGGHDMVRSSWKQFYVRADAIVFMVDSADTDRFQEAKAELQSLLSDKSLDGVSIAVLANKSDLPDSVPIKDLILELGLDPTKMGDVEQTKPTQVFSTSVYDGTGYPEAFRWISSLI
eukprot:TRINITY_DN5412_c0_g2_i1.p1 TRINITY_DN5412_c0_g2~~TRINITY_DN5412_c0_g2_i1.p1  ORF type:complete len:156 (-),score=30.11 TRINITY_DN5412_c0_g2_i1:138-605(-)